MLERIKKFFGIKNSASVSLSEPEPLPKPEPEPPLFNVGKSTISLRIDNELKTLKMTGFCFMKTVEYDRWGEILEYKPDITHSEELAKKWIEKYATIGYFPVFNANGTLFVSKSLIDRIEITTEDYWETASE